MVSMYYRGAVGAIIVFDVTNRETFESFRGWCDDLFRAEPDVVCIIVGNKCDSAQERLVSAEEGQQMTHDIGALYTEASAKTGESLFY